MRFGGHRNQGTYAAAYQSRISTVDGQATFFELDRQDKRLHELFRGYSLRRNYNHWPTLPEYRRHELEKLEPAAADQEADPSMDERGSDMKVRQRVYDQKRQTRDRALRNHQTCLQAETLIPDDFLYESDFVYTRKLMPERDRLAENLFKEGSLRDPVGMTIMDDLVRLLQTKKSQTYCRGLNSSFDACDTCHQQRIGYVTGLSLSRPMNSTHFCHAGLTQLHGGHTCTDAERQQQRKSGEFKNSVSRALGGSVI